MAALPDEGQVRARAEELSLIGPGADLPERLRRKVMQLLLEEAAAPAAPPLPAGELLSRTSHTVPGGVLRVDVVFVPTTPPLKGP